MRYFAAIAAIAFLGGSVASSVLAQEQGQWVSKPVQCGSIEEITAITKMKGLQLTFAGDGVSNSVNFEEPLAVYVFLGINPETNEWAITEIDPQGDTGCVIGYGDSFKIDAETMKKLAGPRS